MNPFIIATLILPFLLALQGCSEFKTSKNIAPPLDASEQLPGGETTGNHRKPSFLVPMANLSLARQEDFYIGFSFFRDPWVSAPSTTTDRDGLGPVFNARSCIVCHPNGGRGRPPQSADDPMLSMFLRLSIPGKSKIEGVVPEPTYGEQLQVRGTSLKNNFGLARENGIAEGDGVIGEAVPYVEYKTINGQYTDGEPWVLRKPIYKIRDAAWGAFHPDTLISPRMAPQLAGLGLLEAISEQDLIANADPEDSNGDGISGRPNHVWDREKNAPVLGRFGYKANQPSLLQQVASAFRGDIGITNDLFKEQPCTQQQSECLAARDGVDPNYGVEINRTLLDATTYFGRMLAIPQRRSWKSEQLLVGRELFYQANCQGCHTPSFITAQNAIEVELSKQKIWPYSDLLLHDLGEGLADGRPDFEANGREWRTTPLWGISMAERVSGETFYLHDGRARSVSEAILWHEGEAQQARNDFVAMEKSERQALLAFVKSL